MNHSGFFIYSLTVKNADSFFTFLLLCHSGKNIHLCPTLLLCCMIYFNLVKFEDSSYIQDSSLFLPISGLSMTVLSSKIMSADFASCFMSYPIIIYCLLVNQAYLIYNPLTREDLGACCMKSRVWQPAKGIWKCIHVTRELSCRCKHLMTKCPQDC